MRTDIEFRPAAAEPSAPQPALTVDEELTAADRALFEHLLVSELPTYYDEVDVDFPRSILDSVDRGVDRFGYFTQRKRLFVARLDGRAVAFSVASYKRGGSVKMGPTVVCAGLRRKGVGLAFRRRVEEIILADPAVRKLYLTLSTGNLRTMLFNLRLGYQVEGVLRGQYREGSHELVMGRIRDPRSAPRHDQTPLPAGRPGSCVTETTTAVEHAELASYLLPRLASHLSAINDSFVDAIRTALAADRQRYARKGKQLVLARRDGELCGVAVLTPKRGGAVKIAPLLADDADGLQSLVAHILAELDARQVRRAYAVVPMTHMAVVAHLCGAGFEVEAQLREPYSAGVDCLVLGRQR
jgi:hypothetical protein